jgi:hypothetical protein
MRSLISTTLLVLGATSAFAQTTPAPNATPPAPAPLQLEVAVRGYGADDRARSLAGDSAVDKIESYVWADRSLCGLGAGNSAPTNTPWVGWHFVGTVQSISSEGGRNAVTFRVEWQRIWDNGARVAEASKGTQSNSLREGERLELDRVIAGAGAGGACGTTNVRLELGAVARPAYRVGLANRAQDMLTSARAGGRGAAAGAIAPKAMAGNTQLPETVKQYKLEAFGLQQSYDAELWLVHRKPDGTEATELKQTIRFTGTDVAFAFPGVVVNTSKGDLTLDFGGTLRAGVGPDAKTFPSFYLRNNLTDAYLVQAGRGGDSFFTFAAPERYARATGADAATAPDNAVRIAVTFARRIRGGNPAIDTRGGSYFFMNVPAPTDVVSFEFPSLPNVSEDLLKGHTFSLRIRVTPVPK